MLFLRLLIYGSPKSFFVWLVFVVFFVAFCCIFVCFGRGLREGGSFEIFLITFISSQTSCNEFRHSESTAPLARRSFTDLSGKILKDFVFFTAFRLRLNEIRLPFNICLSESAELQLGIE